MLARQGEGVWLQPYIDAYLPAVAFLQQNSGCRKALSEGPKPVQDPSHRLHSNRGCRNSEPRNSKESKPQTDTNSMAIARKLILSPTDSPQLGILPDITPALRCMILQTDLEKCGYILTPLYAALPCIKRSAVRKPSSTPDPDTHQVAICILLALLLGLYPTSVKFPPFSVRVAIYKRVHSLLTNGQGIDFCQSHPSLITLALMEYISYIIPNNLPAEHDFLSEECDVQNFFSTCPLTCDTFRQEALETGKESWDSLEIYCRPIVEKHTKACKGRNRNRQVNQCPQMRLKTPFTEHLQYIPYIVPYSIHLEDPTNCIMASEMAYLGLFGHKSTQDPSHINVASQAPTDLLQLTCPETLRIQTPKPSPTTNPVTTPISTPTSTPTSTPITSQFTTPITTQLHLINASDSEAAFKAPMELYDPSNSNPQLKSAPKSAKSRPRKSSRLIQDSREYHEPAVIMQHTVYTHQLPPNLTKLQLSGLSARMRVCERSALSGSVLYVCISCVLANQQTICRKGKSFPTRGQCKYDFDSQSLICSVCQSHSIISISTVGRIISIRNNRFYLTPCCSTVQLYTGRGCEFQDTPDTCPHKQEKISGKLCKKRCEVCSNVALHEPHVSVDHLTGEQHYTYLCQRHTPHSDVLKHVTNWKQLQEEIRKRDKPLFSMRNRGI